MTLDDLADYVCTKSGLTDTAAVVACKKFLSKRYELIYNSYLWKDSLVGVDVTIDPSNEDNAEGIVFLPAVIDRVVAVRTTDRSIHVRGLEDYYRIDFDKFSQTGTPYEFALLAPAWFTWRANDGVVSPYITFSGPIDEFEVKVVYYDQTGKRFVTTGGGAEDQIKMYGSKVTVESVFVEPEDGVTDQLSVSSSDALNDIIVINGVTIALNATETRSPAYQRLRIFNIPDAKTTISVLGKKKFVPLDFDNEEPEIKNLDNCLIAFGMAEMLQYGRRVGQAQTFLQEGVTLLKELAKLETVQAANNSRFIPENGMGDPFFSPTQNAGFTTGTF